MTLRRLIGLVVIVALLAAVGSAAWAWSNGIRFYAVDSGSMSPTFNTGALVVDQPVTAASVYQVGDVITLHPTPGYMVTHRIAAIDANGITTKGDANPTSDVGYVQPAMIVGRLAFSVPLLGYVAMLFQHPMGIAAFLLLIVGLFGAWELSGRDWQRPRRSCAAAVTGTREPIPEGEPE